MYDSDTPYNTTHLQIILSNKNIKLCITSSQHLFKHFGSFLLTSLVDTSPRQFHFLHVLLLLLSSTRIFYLSLTSHNFSIQLALLINYSKSTYPTHIAFQFDHINIPNMHPLTRTHIELLL